jgi:hypothetical protein
LIGQAKELLLPVVISPSKSIKKEIKDGFNKVISKFKVPPFGELNGQDLNLVSYLLLAHLIDTLESIN